MNLKNKLISIVIPIYNEEKNISLLIKELKQVLNKLGCKFEIIFVNDGSRDGSARKIYGFAKNDLKIKYLEFSRNFGKEIALSCGCNFAKGEAVITMDADLQHPPDLIPQFVEKWLEGFEVVYAVRKKSKGISLTKKITSYLYWKIFTKISTVNSEPRSTDFRLMDKKVIAEFKTFSERGRLFRGIIDWMGYKRAKIEFSAPSRSDGKAAYSYGKLFGLAVNSLTAFSLFPLRIAGYLGIFITLSSFILLIVMSVSRWIYNSSAFSSLSFVVVANTFLMGILLVCLGLIALYIARIHDEVINRPLFIIRRKINL